MATATGEPKDESVNLQSDSAGYSTLWIGELDLHGPRVQGAEYFQHQKTTRDSRQEQNGDQ